MLRIMPMIDGFMCKGYIEKENGDMLCIEDDMSEEEQKEFFRGVRNRLGDAFLEIMYNKEKERLGGEPI